MRPNQTQVYNALLEIITAEPTEWTAQIVKGLSEKFEIKNWLTEVRRPLQRAMDEGLIKRVWKDETKPGWGPELYVLL